MKRILLTILSAGVVMTAAAETPLVDSENTLFATSAESSLETSIATNIRNTFSGETVTSTTSAITTSQQPISQRFLPTRRRIDREINKVKFAYKGEFIMGLTASYGTLSSDDTDILVILDNINASGSIATIKPYIGYFYRDNHCLGMRFGYRRLSGTLDNIDVDLGSSNDLDIDIPYLDTSSDNYSFGIFHRSYAGLDPKGRFGLFAEFELSMSVGSSDFAYERGDVIKRVYSDNTQVKLSFNPGAAVYIFPNVCATISFGLGGIQYTKVKQKDDQGNEVGSRTASKMKFKLNIAAINIGMTVHLWDKKKK